MSVFQMWVEIAGVLLSGGAVAVLVVRTFESRPKAASWKMPERIDARLEEILRPKQEESESQKPSWRGMGWKSMVEEPVAIARDEGMAPELRASDVTGALTQEGFLLREGVRAVDAHEVDADAMAHRLEEPRAVYSHEKYQS